MDIGEIVKLDVLDTNENGIGIARHDGMVVFVPGLLEGESAVVQISSVEKNYSIGTCVDRLSTSTDRINNVCPSSDDCGGCKLGFASYSAENKIKQKTVKSALRRAGLPYDLVSETVFADNRMNYRNKIVVHFNENLREFGYHREKSQDGIKFNGCVLCPKIMNEIINYTNEHIEILCGLEPTSLQLRSSLDGITISLYGNHNAPDLFRAYKTSILNEFPGIYDVLYFSDAKDSEKKQYIHDKIFGLDMYFTTEAFRQVNGVAFEKLLTIVHNFANAITLNKVADLYCGSGIIGLSLAKRFPNAKFWGVEINPDAVRDAQHNAEINDIKNITFFGGDAITFKKHISSSEKLDLIIVDPPRAGLSKEMRNDLASFSPESIIYVSCNPQTMSRDMAELCTKGYKIHSVVPVNMFPLTKHVETVVLLSKREFDLQNVHM